MVLQLLSRCFCLLAGMKRSGDMGKISDGEDGLWPRAKAALLSWNRVRTFAGKLESRISEVADLRQEIEQLLHVLKSADGASCS